jgi:hypothetical protein
MIWLTWRQSRVQTAVVYGALAVLAVILAITGPALAASANSSAASFLGQANASTVDVGLYLGGIAVLYAVPAIIGGFWGAPLISRELEAGTHRLVWNQSVTRTRWLAIKLGVSGLAAMAAAGGLSLAVTWWSSPIDTAVANGGGNGTLSLPRIAPQIFDARGIVPIGYAAFAFALGVTAGVVIRRIVPAMAVALAVLVVVQIAVPLWVRPYLITPTQETVTISMANLRGLLNGGTVIVSNPLPSSWALGQHTINGSGQTISGVPSWVADCIGPPGQPVSVANRACFGKLAQQGYRQVVDVQPAANFWPLQWIETAIYLAFALALTGLCVWLIRRRPA